MTTYLLYALALVGGFRLAWVAYGWLVPEAGGSKPWWLRAPEAPPAEGFLGTAAAHLDSAVLDGNQVEHLANGVEIFPAMLEAIEGARESVNLLTFVYWTGDIARRMATALLLAAHRGVDVRLLLDAYGAHRMDARLAEELEDGGVRVAWFHPVRWYQIRRLNNRTHRKILVVDGSTAFTGGVGIAEEWDGDARNPEEWRDDHFRIRGPAVRYLQGAFADDWRESTGEVLVDPRMFRELEPAGPTRMMTLVTAPTGERSPIAFLYWLSLHEASQRLDISTPYFLPDPDLIETMGSAVDRGVRVRLLVPCEHNDSRLLRAASFAHYPALLEHGVELYEYQPTMLHSKRVTIDGRWAIIGSANFDKRSFEMNNEAVAVVDDEGLVGRLEASFQRDLERSRRIDLAAVRARSLPERVASRMALSLRHYL